MLIRLKKLALIGFLGALTLTAGCRPTCALAGGAAAQCRAVDPPQGTAAHAIHFEDREVVQSIAGTVLPRSDPST
jgi:hypothetical protein